MSSSLAARDDDRAVFLQLAELVNSLPQAERVSIRRQLGDYAHDLKHQLGLVTSAIALLERYDVSEDAAQQIGELAAVIGEAARQLDGQVDILTAHLNHQIDTGGGSD